ncbi:MAG: PQQ-binding-like beta-propeller repeat protein [Ignavibacteriaceae bacterium]
MTKIRNKKLCNLFFLFIINLFFINNIHPQVGEVKWRVPTNIIGWSSPAIGPDGAVYIGDNDGYLYAVVDEGETWSFKWEPIKLADDVGECCPTLSEDGKILYIGSNTRPARMFCINTEDGSIKWTYTITPNKTLYGGGLISSPALGHDEKTIYFGTGPWDSDLEPGPTTWLDDRFIALEDLGDTYKVKWIFKPEEETDAVRFSFFGNPAVDKDGSIYIGSFNGYFYKLKDEDNKCAVIWKHAFKRTLSTSVTLYQEVWGSPTIGSNGTVYISTNDWRLWAFNPDGSVKWYFDTDHETWTTPVITNNGLIVFGSEDGYIYGIRDNGIHPVEVWHYPEVSSGAWWGTAAVAADGTIIFGSEVIEGNERGVYYAIDEKDGSYKWQTPSLGFEARTHPAIGDDGTIYVCGGEAGNLYAIRGSAPLANTLWPKMQKDKYNSGNNK